MAVNVGLFQKKSKQEGGIFSEPWNFLVYLTSPTGNSRQNIASPLEILNIYLGLIGPSSVGFFLK